MNTQSAQQANDLSALLPQHYREGLTQAEMLILAAAPLGVYANCGPDYIAQKSQRTVRAAFLRWLCTDAAAATQVDPQGLHVHAAVIDAPFVLSFVSVPFPLHFLSCNFPLGLDLQYVKIPLLDLTDSDIQSGAILDGGVIAGDLILYGCVSTRYFRVLEATIAGDLNCRGAAFSGTPAFAAFGSHISGSVYLSEGFKSAGQADLSRCHIEGGLICTEASFSRYSRLSCLLRDVQERPAALSDTWIRHH